MSEATLPDLRWAANVAAQAVTGGELIAIFRDSNSQMDALSPEKAVQQ